MMKYYKKMFMMRQFLIKILSLYFETFLNNFEGQNTKSKANTEAAAHWCSLE